ncbi:nck-associated protein 5-like isoform X2 [Mastacembelus armatus]|uniref:nck-associated protein 5-like isoform X2 n=1 Tax=Mastacembelus armatus TaxID=205130 RepID=UPI000E45C3FB|nr:nck-associated protein 5-like isoform X2 [Mastacembelus armatus]
MFSAAIKGNSTSLRCLPKQNTSESLGASELATNLLSGEDPAGAQAYQVCRLPQGQGTMNRHLERREHLKRFSLDSSLPEYMDANKCIDELLKQLEEERRNVRREKLAVARLQREVARSKSEGTMREKLIHELEEERRLRLESEKRLREVTEESELGRVQMVSLQQQFSRMEETVRSLLQNQGILEQTAVDTVGIMKAYKDELSEEVQKQHDGPEENGSLLTTEADPGLPASAEPDASQAEEDKDKTKLLLDRLKALEEENSVLAMENENQRDQYERCLDEVANQVVQALLTQKDLREECLKLRTRVFDLEQQNRALSVLFQQRIKPASDLLLQKLHSRIMDLSAADLLLEPERTKAFLLSRNTDSPSNEAQLNGKAGLPVAKCLSQLSLTVPAPVYPRSSCSSSELSLSSACSEFSSGSYTWNDGRSCGKMSSLTWEKRLSLGSSAPSNICAPLEEQLPTRCKESHILEGLRKLQRRKHRSSSSSSKVSKSGYKDCMNSNEGIYSLGIKSGSKGVSKLTHVSRVSAATGKKFSYDSDDADDELVQSSRGDNIPTKDSWFYCKRRSHSISDSLCSLEGLQYSGGGGDGSPGPITDSKERSEKLMSFINSFLPEGGRKSAFTKPSMLRLCPSDPQGPSHISDVDDPEDLNSESSDIRMSFSQPEQPERKLSRDATKLLAQHYLQRDQGRTQSADGRPRPLSQAKESKGTKCTKSEESILAIFDAEGEPIELCAQKLAAGGGAQNEIQDGKEVADYTQLVPQDRPTRQKSANGRNYAVLESPEKPSEYQIRTSKTNSSREGSVERLSMQLTPQRQLVKPPNSRANKGHSMPPLNDSAGPKSSGSKIPGRNKPSGSPLRLSKSSTTEPNNSVNLGPSGQEKSPSSPTVKISRFIKAPGNCSQSPKAVNSKLPSKAEWTKGSSAGSPHLSRRHLEYADNGEQPTRDKHCETSKNKLRSPSPPPPPGRSTSLLIRPNYEGSPQAHKTGVAQPSTPTTVRGPPPSYHTSLVPNMQTTLPIKDKECLDLDAGYGTALAPQKLVDKTSQHLQKSPAMTQTSTKGTSKRMTTKDYLPSANSGCAPEPENAPKNSKNVPPPYSALRGSSLQNSFASKRGSTQENVHQTVQTTSISLPISLQDTTQGKTAPQSSKAVVSPPSTFTMSPNSVEKASKTRIPMGFKAFLKSPPSHKNTPSIPGKQEKDHINSVSKETVTSNVSDILQPPYSTDSPPKMSIAEGKGEAQSRLQEEEVHAVVLPEEGDVCDKGKRSSQLFSRSISVTTKPHLKPALGMNGAKARSQSFSTNYTEKPNINALDGPGKIRTQIITNTGERGNSLSRQSSLEVPSVGLPESPVHLPRTRLSHYGGMTGSNSHSIILERTSKSASKAEGSQGTVKEEAVTSPSQKEAHSLAISDRMSLNIHKPAKVASHPQFHPPSSCVYSSENPGRETGVIATTTNESDFSREVKTQTDSPNKYPDMEERKISPTACTIEEKVMMGIKENVQKCQEQEKVAASEAKQKTGPSLANWFGLRKSKLPALSGKKADPPKGKEEKKELKLGSVLGGKQIKSDKKKDKKKNDNQQKDSQEVQNLSEMNNKLSSIMDHCNNQMGQIASQIQCTTALIGKDQFVKELLGRTAVKGSMAASPPGISTPKKHSEMKGDMEICPDTATLIMTQKIKLRAENEEGHIPDTACQDHMIGSGCQMRTLDSGIGTFPLPDSVTRASGRHIPKSESSPDGVTAGSAELNQEPPSSHPDPSQPNVKVPSLPNTRLHDPTSMGHSRSDPNVTCSSDTQDTESRLPKIATSDAMRTKRLSVCAPHGNISTEDGDTETERKLKTKDHDILSERSLRVCTYSGSSSETETEPEGTRSTLDSPQRTLLNRTKNSDSVENEDTLKRSSVGTSLSIMDYYQHGMFSHLEKDGGRISQYNLLHEESSLDSKAGDRLSKDMALEKTPVSMKHPGSLDFSLESMNQLNHSSSSSGSLYPDTGLGSQGGDRHADARKSTEDSCKVDEPSSSSFSSKPGVDPVGSLSDSLYDSFSSCTSQGSNDV